MQEVFLIKSIFFYKGKWQKTREGKNQQKKHAKKIRKEIIHHNTGSICTKNRAKLNIHKNEAYEG